MKTPQLEHGVYDIATGEEITTPLGLPRAPPRFWPTTTSPPPPA
jgi:hypothetical protein